MIRSLLAATLLLVPAVASAAIGTVAVLEGKATRTPEKGAAVPLAVGTAIELKDTIKVTRGNLRFDLNDGSQIALTEKSELFVDNATFEGQNCTGFLGTLKTGSLWTKVKKMLGAAKYEVRTERAVAGVRGTIFRIDADTLVKAAKGRGQGRHASVVRVTEGIVRVNPGPGAKPSVPKSGPRTEVAVPKEISEDEWEAKFVELQKGENVAVGVDLFEAAELSKAQQNDNFQKWLDKQ